MTIALNLRTQMNVRRQWMEAPRWKEAVLGGIQLKRRKLLIDEYIDNKTHIHLFQIQSRTRQLLHFNSWHFMKWLENKETRC